MLRPDTVKPLEENIGRTLFDMNHSNIFLNSSPRVVEIKTKTNKWDLIKFKSFCTAKETINKKTSYRMGESVLPMFSSRGFTVSGLNI